MSVAVVTGASSGIGAACASELAARGYALLLIAQRADVLARKADDIRLAHRVAIDVLAADLATPDGFARVLSAVAARRCEISYLVNAAGAGLVGTFAHIPADAIDRMLALNAVALTQLMRAVLPGLLAAKSWRILNVASAAAFQPSPNMVVYFVSKAYVLSVSRAVGCEVRGSGVTATAMCPGPTRTEFGACSGSGGKRAFCGPDAGGLGRGRRPRRHRRHGARRRPCRSRLAQRAAGRARPFRPAPPGSGDGRPPAAPMNTC